MHVLEMIVAICIKFKPFRPAISSCFSSFDSFLLELLLDSILVAPAAAMSYCVRCGTKNGDGDGRAGSPTLRRIAQVKYLRYL